MKKKAMAVLLAAVVVMSALFAGCGKENPVSETNAETGENTENAGASRTETSWGKSIDAKMMEAFKRRIEEKTNTQIEMIAPPASDYQDRLNVLLTSGEIPDIYVVQAAQDNIPL